MFILVEQAYTLTGPTGNTGYPLDNAKVLPVIRTYRVKVPPFSLDIVVDCDTLIINNCNADTVTITTPGGTPIRTMLKGSRYFQMYYDTLGLNGPYKLLFECDFYPVEYVKVGHIFAGKRETDSEIDLGEFKQRKSTTDVPWLTSGNTIINQRNYDYYWFDAVTQFEPGATGLAELLQSYQNIYVEWDEPCVDLIPMLSIVNNNTLEEDTKIIDGIKKGSTKFLLRETFG